MAGARQRLAAVASLVAAFVAVPSAPRVEAAPARCATPPPVGADSAPTPWAQARLGVGRLDGIADGTGVTVAVLDSGVDAGHPQLAGRVVAGADPLDGGDGRLDCVGHGTAVASLIAAAPREGVAFRGVAPGATILPVRVSEQDSAQDQPSGRAVDPTRFAAAIRFAVDRGARVLNLSLVIYQDDPAVRAAVRYALDRDVVVVAAVGNRHEQGDPTPYPAAYDGVVGVGAVGPDGDRLATSTVGPFVDLVAPGSQVVAASPGRGLRLYEGTSFAAPFVAATAALVRQYWPRLDAEEVGARLLATADPAGTDGAGAGVVNPYRAVTDQLGAGPQALPPTPTPIAVRRADVGVGDTRARAVTLAVGGAVLTGGVLLVGGLLTRRRRRAG